MMEVELHMHEILNISLYLHGVKTAYAIVFLTVSQRFDAYHLPNDVVITQHQT